MKRFLLRLFGWYVRPTDRERRMAVIGRTRVYRTERGDRGEFTLAGGA